MQTIASARPPTRGDECTALVALLAAAEGGWVLAAAESVRIAATSASGDSEAGRPNAEAARMAAHGGGGGAPAPSAEPTSSPSASLSAAAPLCCLIGAAVERSGTVLALGAALAAGAATTSIDATGGGTSLRRTVGATAE